MENKNPVMAQKEGNGMNRKEKIEDRITTLFAHSPLSAWAVNGWDLFDLCYVLNEEEEVVEQVLSEMAEAGRVVLAEQEVL